MRFPRRFSLQNHRHSFGVLFRATASRTDRCFYTYSCNTHQIKYMQYNWEWFVYLNLDFFVPICLRCNGLQNALFPPFFDFKSTAWPSSFFVWQRRVEPSFISRVMAEILQKNYNMQFWWQKCHISIQTSKSPHSKTVPLVIKPLHRRTHYDVIKKVFLPISA